MAKEKEGTGTGLGFMSQQRMCGDYWNGKCNNTPVLLLSKVKDLKSSLF